MKKTLQTLKELYPDEDIYGLLCLKKDNNSLLTLIMSLHDMYFSQRNKNYMYDILFSVLIIAEVIASSFDKPFCMALQNFFEKLLDILL